jgi:tetratricopeptide (TPR) repeat protein
LVKFINKHAEVSFMPLNLENLEALLDQNKPVVVVKKLVGYKGRNGRVIFILAEARRLLGDFEGAIKLYNRAIQLYKKYAEEASYAETIIDMNLALAKCYRTLGDASKAQELAAMARAAARRAGLKDFEMQSLQEFAMALRAAGRLEYADEALNEVLAYYQKQEDLGGQSFIWWALGGISRLKGQFKQGVEQFNKAIDFARKGGDKISQAYSYCGLAGISRIGGDIEACVANYLKAERIFRNTDDIFGKAYTNCGMANGLRQLGRYREALKRYDVADKLYSRINDRVDLGFVKWGRAEILRRRNKLYTALAELKKARELFASSDEIRGQLLTEFSLAQAFYAMGRRGEAVKVYDRALERARAEGLGTYLEVYT